MRAYWYDNKPVSPTTIPFPSTSNSPIQGDQREPHDSSRDVSTSDLSKLGVLYYHMPDISSVDALATSRFYKNRDVITVSPEKMGDIYEEKVKMFFHEHLHEDEEIRYVRDGAGYFDVRSEGDDWVRIRLEKDDLIILPAGIYHRFTTDEKNVSLILVYVCVQRELIWNQRSILWQCDCLRMNRSGRQRIVVLRLMRTHSESNTFKLRWEFSGSAEE